MHKKIVSACSHSNKTVGVSILNIVKKSPTSPAGCFFLAFTFYITKLSALIRTFLKLVRTLLNYRVLETSTAAIFRSFF